MSIAWLLIALSLVLLAIAVAGFFWAVDHGQFDDLNQAGESILKDEDSRAAPK